MELESWNFSLYVIVQHLWVTASVKCLCKFLILLDFLFIFFLSYSSLYGVMYYGMSQSFCALITIKCRRVVRPVPGLIRSCPTVVVASAADGMLGVFGQGTDEH